MMKADEKQQALIDRLGAIEDWEERYMAIMKMAKALESYPDAQRDEKHLVKGCQSRVWLHATHEDGRVHYVADSDALIVKGLIAMVVEIYSDKTFDDVIATPPRFVQELGIGKHFSQTRSNGLAALLKQVKLYALALKSMSSGANVA